MLTPEELKAIRDSWKVASKGDEMDGCDWAYENVDKLLDHITELEAKLAYHDKDAALQRQAAA